MLTQEQITKLQGAGYSDDKIRAYQAVKQQTPKEEGVVSDIKSAAAGGVEQMKKGYEQAKSSTGPLDTLNAGLNQTLGAAHVALSPLAPITKPIGKAFNTAQNALSETPLIKGAAGNLVQSGAATEYVPNKNTSSSMKGLELISNTSEALGLIGGSGMAKGAKISLPRMGETTGNISKAGSYARSAISDVIPTKQGFINEEVAKALDLTPGDLSNISKSSGNEVGPWLSEHNLIGKNKAETQKNINSFFKENYVNVRQAIKEVPTVYKQSQVPRYVDALKQLENQIKGVPGLEKDAVKVENLLNQESVSLTDVQMAKELIDDYFTLYKVTGDVAANTTKQGLANVRGELKTFIEDEVKKSTGTDIGSMNNSVATARSLEDAIITRNPVGLKKSNLRMGDLGIFGIGWGLGGPLVGAGLLFGKKLIESPTMRLRLARMVDGWSDAQKQKAAQQLQSGSVPKEFQEVVEPRKQPWNRGFVQIGPRPKEPQPQSKASQAGSSANASTKTTAVGNLDEYSVIDSLNGLTSKNFMQRGKLNLDLFQEAEELIAKSRKSGAKLAPDEMSRAKEILRLTNGVTPPEGPAKASHAK